MEVGRCPAGRSISFRAKFAVDMQTPARSLNMRSVLQQGFSTLSGHIHSMPMGHHGKAYSHTRFTAALRLDQVIFGDIAYCCITYDFVFQPSMFVYLATASCCLYKAPDCSAALAWTKLAVQIIVLLYSTSQASCYTRTADFLSSSLFSLHARRHFVLDLMN